LSDLTTCRVQTQSHFFTSVTKYKPPNTNSNFTDTCTAICSD